MSALRHRIHGALGRVARSHGWVVWFDAGRPAPSREVPYVDVYANAFHALPPEGRNALVDAARELLVAHAPEAVWADLLEGGKLRFVDEENEKFHDGVCLCVVGCSNGTAVILFRKDETAGGAK